MAFQPLLQDRAVLDLCGGEVILPISGSKGSQAPGQLSEIFDRSTLPSATALTKEDEENLQHFLIEYGYQDVNHRRAGGKTGMGSQSKWKYPLHTAVTNRLVDMVKILLVAGADKTVTDNQNMSPLDLAKRENPRETDEALNEIVKVLEVATITTFTGRATEDMGDSTIQIQTDMKIISRFVQTPEDAVTDYAQTGLVNPSIPTSPSGRSVAQEEKVGEFANSPSLATLTKTLSLGAGLLHLWAKEAREPQVEKVSEAFHTCLKLAKLLPRPLLLNAVKHTASRTALQTDFMHFLSAVVRCVRSLEPGGVVVIPLGWVRTNISRAQGEETDDGGHCVLVVVSRPPAPPQDEEAPKEESPKKEAEATFVGAKTWAPGQAPTDEEAPKDGEVPTEEGATTDENAPEEEELPVIDEDFLMDEALKNEKWTVGIVNTGEGLEYHPLSASGTAPNPGTAVRQSPLVLTDVPARRVICSSFWYLTFRQIVHPSKSNGPAILYELLFPALNQKPLSANAPPEDLVSNVPTPVTGDGSYALCFERAVRFALAASGSSPSFAAWSGVELRCKLVTQMKKALVKANELRIALSAGELAFLRVATRSLACASSEYTSQCHGQLQEEGLVKVKACIEETDSGIADMEVTETSAWSLHPPPLAIDSENFTLSTKFANFEPLLSQKVEHLKGVEDPPRILVPALTCMMPKSVSDPKDAAATVRLTAHLLTLLVNQQDQIAHSVPARFSLVVHLVTRLLPMPLPLDHPEKSSKCFWTQKMLYETKADLMKHICLISRHFAAVAFTVRARREADGARVCVAAALAAIMDALLRQPVEYLAHANGIAEREQLISSLISLHYSGKASGPCKPFGIALGHFEKQSESLLLLSPEYASLRSLLLNYFRSTSATLDKDHVIFKFDRSMECSDGDRLFVAQVGLSLGIGDAHREAHLLLTGKRPDLLELYPELGFFRDVVFLWKMLLLPIGEGPPQKNWRANDSVLDWSHDGTHFRVQGFEMDLCATMDFPDEEETPGKPPWWLRMFAGGGYTSAKKALSGASPSVLTDSIVNNEDDILHLDTLPTFNDTLGPADSELLLTYLTAPYIRVPLVLGFFTDRERISLLREPQLQAVLDAALFEPGPWAQQDMPLPDTIPAWNRKHLSCPVGLLFNELLKSPKVVLNAILSMLRTAVDKDNGQPGSANEPLILYLVRLAVRVESYLLFIIEHIRQDSYLKRSGAYWSAKVPGLLGAEASEKIAHFREIHQKLREVLTGEVYDMLQNWHKQAIGRKREAHEDMETMMIACACRAQAHLALLYKNISEEQFGVREVAIILSAQLYLNMNHRFASIYTTEEMEAKYSLGASEFELFDMFEGKRSPIADWLRKESDKANEVFEKVEQVVNARGTVDQLFPGENQQMTRVWVELHDQPGNFVPKVDLPKEDALRALRDEDFNAWLQRTSALSSNTSLMSVNLGTYKTQREKVQRIPEWAVQSPDYQEAFGRNDVQCSDISNSADRACKNLAGHRHEIQRWTENAPIPDTNFSKLRRYQPTSLGQKEQWLSTVFEPVRESLSSLEEVDLYLMSTVSSEQDAEVWMTGIMETEALSAAGVPVSRKQLKRVMVQRSPPLVEVYNVIEYGRQFYQKMIYSSDTMWSFYSPESAKPSLLQPNPKAAFWTLASGDPEDFFPPTPSVVTYRRLNDNLGRQMYVPPRLLHGLLPETLIERYKFWRSEDTSPDKGLLIGDEKQACDSPTRILVHLSQDSSSKSFFSKATTETVARIERWSLKNPDDDSDSLWWEADQQKGPEVLVNMRKSLPTLATLLARLENLSHILAWTRQGSGEKSLNALHQVELPRLHLSFSGASGHLNCNQHTGYWLVEQKCTGAVAELLTHWGGGTVLLENKAGEYLVLVSAVAEPISPAAWGAEVQYMEQFLPGQFIFWRGHDSWISNVPEGSRHYSYPVHLTGTFVFTPTWAAKLYLMLCRFAMWKFEQVAAMSITLSEVLTTEEKQLWDHLKYFESGRHADASACRLRLSLAAEPYGESTTPPWDVKSELLAYIRKRHLVSVNCALNPDQEMKLLRSLHVSVLSQNLDLRVRLSVLECLGGSGLVETATGEMAGRINASLGNQLYDIGFERVCDNSFETDVSDLSGLFKAGGAAGYNLSGPGYNRVAAKGMSYYEGLFPDVKGGVSSIEMSWWLLYELYTGSVKVYILEGDDPDVWASFLLRLLGKDCSCNVELSILRAFDLNPEVRSLVKKFGESGVVAQAAKTLKKHLKEGSLKLTTGDYPEPSPENNEFRFLPEIVKSSPRAWSGPMTYDLSENLRVFQNTGEHFEGQPLAQIVKMFVEQSVERGDSASTKEVKHGIDEIAPHLTSFSGTSTLSRLKNQLEEVFKMSTTKSELKSGADLSALSTELANLKQKDIGEMQSHLGKVVQLANQGSVANWLCRRAGHLTDIKFGMVVRALLAEKGKAESALRIANPMLSDEEIGHLFDETAQLLCRTVRIGQISRAQAAITRLQKTEADDKARGAAHKLHVKLMQQAVASELSTERHFTEMTGSGIEYDPRLLVFEFLFNLVLRHSQVDLMKQFAKCVNEETSKVHQMIMGAGKTTVIAPLLAILLADGERLVVTCMPQELLSLSRSVLMEKFSAAILPKPVLTLHFERFSSANEALLTKLEAARRRRAIVVAAPNSLKSLLLKQVALLDQLDMARRYSSDAGGVFEPTRSSFFSFFGGQKGPVAQKMLTTEEIAAKTSEVVVCNKILKMFHKGSMLMDEVDLLLDPRKSELNWPLGARVALDLTESGKYGKNQEGLRYKLPFHLLDGIFVAAQGAKMTMPYTDRQEATDPLKELRKTIEEGEKTKRLQLMPHLIVLSTEFYKEKMMPHIARWACLFLENHTQGILGNEAMARLLIQPEIPEDLINMDRLRGADDVVHKLLNLTREWLHTLLPHVLGKVHRVSYGLLTGDDYRKAPPGTPQSRKFLAIPFVGKDRPSGMSEFQHPDITLGFTILSYRYNGMRQVDMTLLWKIMINEMKVQNMVEYHRRESCRAYVFMVTEAGGLVRGFDAEGTWVKDLEGEEQARRDKKRMAPSSVMKRLWPLEAIDVKDPEQIGTLFNLLHTSAHSIRYFLEQFVFIPHSGVLDSNSNQLSASGQELAGKQMFGFCLGFSGTPNNLLPKSMGDCEFAKTDDGEIVAVLGSPDVVSVEQRDTWSPTELLNIIATSKGDSGPKYHALIDTGALITGMSNYEVAEYLLKAGLKGIEGVIFLDSDDERMVLVRNGMRVMHMAQCGLSPEERFTFYDHVHTTGMDIKQPLTCTALQTISKDMSFRDYAQGAYRMRGIGKGQCIEVFLIPEVFSLMNHVLGNIEGSSEQAHKKKLLDLQARRDHTAWTQAVIIDLIQWLLVNGIRSEDKRHLLLCQQSVENIWRRAASSYLEEQAPASNPAEEIPKWIENEATKLALNVLRNRIDTNISNTLERAEEDNMKEKLTTDMLNHLKTSAKLWPDDTKKKEDSDEGWKILQALPDREPSYKLDLEVTKVKEKEVEQETEQEHEKEQQQQQEMERDNERMLEAPTPVKFSRDDEKINPWPISILQKGFHSFAGLTSNPFYEISQLSINTSLFFRTFRKLGTLPKYVMVSDNYFRRSWGTTRRLKNVICFLEWVPDARNLPDLKAKTHLSEEQKANIHDAFQFWDTNKSGELSGQELALLLKDLGLGRQSKEIIARNQGKKFNVQQIEKEIASQSFYDMQDGRYFIILSLDEAEHLRASMHLLDPKSWPLTSGLALRCIGNLESALHDSLIDQYGEVLSTVKQNYQLESAEQLLRFTNQSMGYQREEISILLRLLQEEKIEDRRDWWLLLRSCRRRTQRPWEQLPIAAVFTKADEFGDLPMKALLSNIRWAFAVLGMSPADAFHKLDTDHGNALSRQELQKGLHWIRDLVADREYWSRHVDKLFEYMDKDHNGVINPAEFKQFMEVDEEEKKMYSMPHNIRKQALEESPEPADYSVKPQPAAENLRQKSRGRFQIKWETFAGRDLQCVWDSRGTMSELHLAIWKPIKVGAAGGMFEVTEAVCLGHFMCTEKTFEAPKEGVMLLTVKDTMAGGVFGGKNRDSLNNFLEVMMPLPLKFRKEWTLRRPLAAGDACKDLYVWKAVPPTDAFIALGCIATTEDQEPPLESIRCVPKAWAQPAKNLIKAWNDVGMGGTAAAFWRVDTPASMAVFDITIGRDSYTQPTGVYYMQESEHQAFSSDTPTY